MTLTVLGLIFINIISVVGLSYLIYFIDSIDHPIFRKNPSVLRLMLYFHAVITPVYWFVVGLNWNLL